jgi:hypothetical protein
MTDSGANTPKFYDLPHTTKFYQKDLDTLKGMLAGANHTAVDRVADNWTWVHDRLVGGSDGGLKKELDDAVNAVLEHWSGSAADGFRARATLISDNISAAAPYARNVSNATRSAASSLKHYKQQLDAVQKPSGTDSAMDAAGNYALSVVTLGSHGGRDDSKANSELERGVPTQDVLSGNAGELSEGKERQLQGAIVMEYLGAAYRSQAAGMGKPNASIGDPDHIEPPDHNTPITPVVPVPSSVKNPKRAVSGSTSTALTGVGHPSAGSVQSPGMDGISGGIGRTPGSSVSPPIGTGLDGTSTGVRPSAGGQGSGSLSGHGIPGASVGSGPGGVGASDGTAGGVIGGAAAGGAGAGARGRAGAAGMGAAGGLAKGAGSKGPGGRGRGALARQRGGIVGAAKGGASAGEQGGSGLHRSRGGSGAGKSDTGGRGMMGRGYGSQGKRDSQHSESDRPDYLVEDEETWTPEQDVAPRVIE